MEWVSSWIQGIIIAVIISTIIEMILPEGNSKKYIKVVIGVYILFSMVSPVITKITGSNFKVSDIFNLEEYIEVSKNSASMQNQLENQNQTQIKQIYIDNMKNNINEKIEAKGYLAKNISLKIENNEEYTLQEIRLQITKKEENNKTNENDSVNQVTTVNEVNIQINNTQSNINNKKDTSSKKSSISSQEQKELKEYLSSVYEIQTKNIHINE